MKQFRRLSGWAVVLSVFFASARAFAFGEFTLEPSYYFKAAKFDVTRFGLYIQEDLEKGTPWFYSSWTGAGKVFLNSATLDQIFWFTTQHDINYNVSNCFRVGGGAGFSTDAPTSHNDVDIHLKLTAKLW